MRQIEVVLGDVIDGHVAARFYLTDDQGRRCVGTLAVPHQGLDLIEFMIEAADKAAEVASILNGHVKTAGFDLRTV